MSELREAAQAVINDYDGDGSIEDTEDAIANLRAALAQPETEPEPVAWAVMCDGNAAQTCLTEIAANLIAESLREQNRGRDFDWQTIPLYAHPPRDEWRPASEPPEGLQRRVIAWRYPPRRQGGAWIEALYDDGAWVTRDGIAHDITHWRDVQPPTESTIATEIKAARDEIATWPKERQDAARASAVAVPTEGA